MAKPTREQAAKELADIAFEMTSAYEQAQYDILMDFGADEDEVQELTEKCERTRKRIDYLHEVI